AISMEEVDEAIDRVIAGPAKRSRVVSEKERQLLLTMKVVILLLEWYWMMLILCIKLQLFRVDKQAVTQLCYLTKIALLIQSQNYLIKLQVYLVDVLLKKLSLV